MPFITHVVKLNAGLVPSLLNSYSHCVLLYHTDNIPDYTLVWKGWESHIVQSCLKRRCPDYWVQWPVLVLPPRHFPSWLPVILKLVIISKFSPEIRGKERAIFTALSFYDILLICSYFVFHFYSPKFPFYLKPLKTKQKIQPWIKYTVAANQNHYEIPFHTSQNGCDPKVYK